MHRGPFRLAAALLIAAGLTAGCSATPDDPRTVSADEDRQLNDAAATLDANAPAADNGSPTP